MAFECGFFNSVLTGGVQDRVYTAEHMNIPYHRIVSNGVFAMPDGTPSTDLQVTANNNMVVTVKTGEGIFFDKWFKNDANYNITVDASHSTYARIDSIVVRINNTERTGSIEYKKGEASSSPVAPTLFDGSNGVKEYRLANITLNATATSISQGDITDTRPSSDCGWVTHLLYQSDITATYAQWQEQFNDWFQEVKETLASATLIRSYTSHYTTATQDEDTIPIQITQFNKTLDILQVYINGLMLIKDVDYTNDSNEYITLTKPLDVGQSVAFIVYKSVDGSEAESVIDQVLMLQSYQVVSNTGGAKYTLTAGQNILDMFMTYPAGFMTLYAPSTVTGQPTNNVAYRYFGHLTVSRGNTSIGWLMAYKSDGKVYNNFLNAGVWSGWKEVTNSTQITADNGGAKIEITSGNSVLQAFVNAGTGFHTMYSASGATDVPKEGAYRYFGHMTGSTTGYIFAMSTAGSIYSNYLYSGTWRGWKVIHEVNTDMLWEGALYMVATANVVPSKPLSECQHGWVLVWSDYDPVTETKNQYNVVTCYVPKKNAVGNNWNGSSYMCALPLKCNNDGTFEFTCKQVYIYNDHITGFAGNNQGDLNKGVVLSCIYEY